MNIRYSTNKLKKQFSSASEIKKAHGERAKMVTRRISEITAAPSLAVLIKLPGANCHALVGSRAGDWAVNISGNHRMIFILDHNPIPTKDDGSINTILVTDIEITGTEDYH